MRKLLSKIQTAILILLAAGTPVAVVVSEQYWFEKRVALAGAAVVLLTLWAARTWRIGRIGLIGPIRNLGWALIGAAMLVAAIVPAGRVANLASPELWVGVGAVLAYFAIKNTTSSSQQIKLGFAAALIGLVVAAALGAAGIGRIGPIRPMAEQTLEILKRSPIWGEFREIRVARLGILQIASGLGILGILGVLALAYQLIAKSAKNIFKSGSLWWKVLNLLVLVFLVAFLVLPNPAITLWPLAITAALACGIGQIGPIGPIRKYAWAGFAGALVLVIIGSSYGLGRVVWGELKFREALAAANRNEGIATYYALLEAIKRNPYEVRYHLLASQIDIALANSIAAQAAQERGSDEGEPRSEEATPSARLTAQDQNNILILIQQAVVEGKAAIKLDPENSFLWQNLASIYRSLIGVAMGAEDWALKSYQRAAELAPKDPSSWVGIGEIHFLAGNFQGAADAFQEAVWKQEDFTRAHYNLAVAFNAMGEIDRAIEGLEKVLTLLPQDDPSWEQVERDLAFLRGEREPGSDESEKERGSFLSEPRSGGEPGSETEELKEATTSAEVQPPPPPVGPEATESAEPEPIEVVP